MSNSVRPHRWQPTRLHRPWDSPSKNTGVGCQFLLQCMKVKSESEVAQPCPTLSDPMDCSLPGSSVHGISQARVLEWGAIAFSLGNTRHQQPLPLPGAPSPFPSRPCAVLVLLHACRPITSLETYREAYPSAQPDSSSDGKQSSSLIYCISVLCTEK